MLELKQLFSLNLAGGLQIHTRLCQTLHSSYCWTWQIQADVWVIRRLLLVDLKLDVEVEIRRRDAVEEESDNLRGNEMRIGRNFEV